MSLRRKGNVYYDFDTKNKSFLVTAKDLKINGVKNYYFFLALYDPDLYQVDPYDENLSDVMRYKIITECIRNPWYFLREVSRIPEQGSGYIQFQLNRATLAAIWLFLNGIDCYLTIARQIGKTQSMLAILLWAFLFGTTDSEILFLNLDQGRANANLFRLKRQRELLPEYLRLKFKIDEKTGKVEKGTDNVKSLECQVNRNSIITRGKATSEESADSIGRGNTQPIQYLDEFDFIAFIKKILQASGPAYVTASKNAAKNNAVHGRIFTSTPGDLDSRAGKEAITIINKMFKWSETFYDKDINVVKDIIAKGSDNKIVYVEYHYNLLGKDEEWFLEQCRVLENDPIAIKREIFLRRIHGSSLSPYAAEDLEAIESMKGKIIEELYINKLFKLDIYKKLNPLQIYFVGVDVADGWTFAPSYGNICRIILLIAGSL